MSAWSRIAKVTLGCALAIGFSAWAVGCRQGEGERCQVNKDCGPGLVCNRATATCASDDNTGMDDANNLDGPIDVPDDAAPDAPPDSM